MAFSKEILFKFPDKLFKASNLPADYRSSSTFQVKTSRNFKYGEISSGDCRVNSNFIYT